MTLTLLPAVEINPPTPAKASIIWLHGLGADGHDFAGIVPELNLPAELAVRFVLPHAPHRPVTLNGGLRMPAWFDLYGLSEHSPVDEAGIHETQQAIHQWIEHEIAAGISPARIILAGFSQGGAAALLAGLTYPQALAGILGLSTFLPAHSDLTTVFKQAKHVLPILLTHGMLDPIVPLHLGELTKEVLLKAGYPVTWHTYPMAHQVCPAEIADIAQWLQARLKQE